MRGGDWGLFFSLGSFDSDADSCYSNGMRTATYSLREDAARAIAENPGMDLDLEFGRLWHHYRKALMRCRRKASPKPLHRLRLALRKLVVALGFCQTAHPSRETAEIAQSFKKQLKRLGALRDIHTQIASVTRCQETWPCMSRYGKVLRARQKQRRRKLALYLCGLNIKKVKTLLVKGWMPCLSTLQNASSTSGSDIEKAWDHLRSLRLEFQRRVGTLDGGDAGSLHRLRVAIKHLRYALEFLHPVLNLKEEAALHQLTAWQMQLGRVQDMSVLLDDLKEWLMDQRESVRKVFRNPCRHLSRRLVARAHHMADKIRRTPLRWKDDAPLSGGECVRGNGRIRRCRPTVRQVVNHR